MAHRAARLFPRHIAEIVDALDAELYALSAQIEAAQEAPGSAEQKQHVLSQLGERFMHLHGERCRLSPMWTCILEAILWRNFLLRCACGRAIASMEYFFGLPIGLAVSAGRPPWHLWTGLAPPPPPSLIQRQ